MRIGLVIERFDPQRGGAEYWTFQFAQRLLARGHEVHVVAEQFSEAGLRLPVVPQGNWADPLHRPRSLWPILGAASPSPLSKTEK